MDRKINISFNWYLLSTLKAIYKKIITTKQDNSFWIKLIFLWVYFKNKNPNLKYFYNIYPSYLYRQTTKLSISGIWPDFEERPASHFVPNTNPESIKPIKFIRAKQIFNKKIY